MILQREYPQSLTSHGHSPVGQPPLLHGLGGLALKGLHHRDLVLDDVGILIQFLILEKVGNKRMQPVDRDKLLREVERRTEVIGSPVDMVQILKAPDVRFAWVIAGEDPVVGVYPTAQSEDPGARREDRIPLSRLLGVVGLAKVAHDDPLESICHHVVLLYKTVPVRIHAQVQWLVIEQLGRPLDRMYLGDLRRHHEPSDFE